MESVRWLSWGLAGGGVLAALTCYPYIATAIAYRGSDNGLAYILLVMGVALWNAMFAAQLLDSAALVKGFFLSLSCVGAALAGLGWVLFAGTASSTIAVPRRRAVYTGAALLVGLDIALVITNPAHEWYWVLAAEGASMAAFAALEPNFLYWAHTLLLVVLFGAGAALFCEAWRVRINPTYSRGYTVAGVGTVVAIVGSSVVLQGGLTVAPLAAAALTTTGWVQATRGRPFARYRSYLGSWRASK